MAIIKGTRRDDNLIGTNGNDTFIASDGNDTINGLAGIDTVDYSNYVYDSWYSSIYYDVVGGTIEKFIDQDQIFNIEIIKANPSGDSEITAQWGSNANSSLYVSLDPSPGNEMNLRLTGTSMGMGDFSIRVENFTDVTGTAGNDTIIGNRKKNSLFGYQGNDTVKGGGGADWLRGGDGDDSVDGGLGNDDISGAGGIYSKSSASDVNRDTLTGGAGRDLFRMGKKYFAGEVFSDVPVSYYKGTGFATITDFESFIK